MYNFFMENIKKYEDNILKNDYKNLECQEEFEKKIERLFTRTSLESN